MKKQLFLITFLLIASSQPALAQPLSQFYSPGQSLGQGTLADFIQPFITSVTVIAGVAAFFTTIVAGFRYVASAGNAKDIQNATNMLTYSLIGLGIASLAFVATQFFFQLGGIPNVFGPASSGR